MEESEKKKSERYYVGIDAGSVSMNCIVIDEDRNIVHESQYIRHMGKVEEETLELIGTIYKKWDREKIRAIAFTGNHGRDIAGVLDCFYEFETISQVLGALFLRPGVRTIMSMGGQDTALFQISYNGKAEGRRDIDWELEYFNTNQT